MNMEEPHRDQAERLRKRMARPESESRASSLPGQLPPRSEVHKRKRKKTKWKLKYPVIRLLVLFFILLPIIIFSVYTSQLKGNSEKTSNERDDYETVDFDGENADEQTVKDESANEGTDTDSSEKNEAPSETNELVVNNTEKAEVPVANDGTEPKVDNQTASPTNSTSNKGKDEPSSDEKIIYHKVKSNETLYRIAMNYYHSPSGIEIIKKANGIQGNEIQTGQTLKIPVE
jgi:LysM repeat protein